MLRSKNVTFFDYDFLALEVRVPKDGLSKSPNWCYDYKYLCEDFHRRPTGCSNIYSDLSDLTECRDVYNSDMDTGSSLQCNPSQGIAQMANCAFSDLRKPARWTNSFAFFQCAHCNKTILGSRSALAYMRDFFNLYINETILHSLSLTQRLTIVSLVCIWLCSIIFTE